MRPILGFDARPPREFDGGVLMIYDAAGFALALGPTEEPIVRPAWMHFGVGLPDRSAVLRNARPALGRRRRARRVLGTRPTT